MRVFIFTRMSGACRFGQDVEDLKLHTKSLDSMRQGAIEVHQKSQVL